MAEVQAGRLSWSELAERLLQLEPIGVGAHHPDVDRGRRCGFGEVIFGSGKSLEDIAQIAERLLGAGQIEVLVTRVESSLADALQARFAHTRYDDLGRTLRVSMSPVAEVAQPPCPAPTTGSRTVEVAPATKFVALPVAVVTAGSTDLPVAREALETLRWMGVDADLICDVGVAGPYRLLPYLERLRRCACLVVVAGMEGALVSVVGGLVPCPVIAVPTSVGYGANFAGVTTLLSMLSSCAAGVTVVNIDAGFKGGYVAGLIATRRASDI